MPCERMSVAVGAQALSAPRREGYVVDDRLSPGRRAVSRGQVTRADACRAHPDVRAIGRICRARLHPTGLALARPGLTKGLVVEHQRRCRVGSRVSEADRRGVIPILITAASRCER